VIQLHEKNTNIPIGSINEEQLQFLIDQLEEESLEDKDYAITPLLLSAFEAEGADPNLIMLLKRALGDRDEMIIIWSK
jgi:processive 1,2-diacylglycerol beta-glucosyltransferase